MSAVDITIAAVLCLVGYMQWLSATRASGLVRRVVRDRTRPVSQIEAGPVEVAGAISCGTEPLRDLDDVACAAIESKVSYRYRAGGKTFEVHHGIEQIDMVPVEVRDATGVCSLRLEHVLLLGQPRSWDLSSESMQRSHGNWVGQMKFPEGATLLGATVEQSRVPIGGTVFVSGMAEADDSAVPGEGYRETRTGFRIVGSPERPLVLSAYEEGALLAQLRRPIRYLRWGALVTWITAAAFVALFISLSRAAGS